ncbi:S-adenosylmethionine:tRNA ribosyltransferase-isomerase [Catelliglobosispora koreensis]|uniref:S-adenosylmethionine:tRNA ribosyltransferase-isomerase n=1 Tax=Catelliglobosispora koreensis TaxID=129052 RepID=UPI0003744017|nr:S-adenosylmethionine:tRNA ribosyltransferase-isomerase [Catelliglobosispora koreensis]
MTVTYLEAHEPPEARGLARDHVALLAATPHGLTHHRFTELPSLLLPGDVLLINTSATLPAAVSTVDGMAVHFSTELPDGSWVVEPRHYQGGAGVLHLKGDVSVLLKEPYSEGRLWVATVSTADVPGYLMRHGKPIRYSYVDADWPLSYYQTVFGQVPGSAEMPSASRPFTADLVTQLVSMGIVLAPLTLHTGVASAEAHERPYPERFDIPDATVRLVNEARAAGQRIIAVGTTAVRAIETVAQKGLRRGWTSLVVTPETGVRLVDGLITGFHEPKASHLLMLEAIAGKPLLDEIYREAVQEGYLFHEFGDLNLILRR